jgi:hypothetical protein
MFTIKRHTSLGLALTLLAVLAAGAAVPAQQYLPNRPPMSVSFQGAENPVWYSVTFFCSAAYEWQGDRYGQMGRLMDNANVRIGIRSDRRDRELDAMLTTTVFSGSPSYGTRFTTPSCGGRETADFDVIGKLYGYALARVGPATFVRKLAR